MNESEHIANQLIAIIMPLTRSLSAELRKGESSLDPAHLGALAMLLEGPCNLSELAEYQGVSLPTMSGSISRLESRGWVRRERSTADRRVVLIELTPKGQKRFAEIAQQAQAYIAGTLSSLTLEERELVSSGLTVLQKLFK
jgi:DNA-binding MarR family transcriptional regulator